ncbi:MAG: RNA 2',3'-cyclic phosphodiesterase [Firmicutes bacterium]|nr:RNA 2',3'-cyclic phosphodiesterase [Bacillota bacterium]
MAEPVIRCFIAVPLDPRTQEAVAAVARPLVAAGRPVKWVEPHNLHFTLKFLGDVPERKLGAVGRAVSRGVSGFPRFEVVMGGVGTFPPGKPPRVVWLGVRGGRDTLADLAAAVDRELVREGFPAEKRAFAPHLTLGRVRIPTGDPALSAAIGALAPVEVGPVWMERVCLMKSTLTPSGPIYGEIEGWSLQ